MSVDAKRVQAVFLAVVEIEDAAQREAVLDRECAGDAELRQRIEALLRAHDAPVSILKRPAATPLGDHTMPLEDSPSQAGRSLGDPKQNLVTTAAAAEEDKDPLPLDFLQPSSKPGSLGRLGHYEVLEVLGQGGFGVVVRAFDEKLQRVVAIKVLSAQLAATSPARRRYLREARASAKVRQEHVVQIYAVEEQPIPYLVMEYIPGRTLQQKLDENGPLEVPEMLRLAVQIARGLAAAHAQGLIHRDIKPANILLEEAIEAHAKLTDFGLARAADDASLTQSGVVAGTPMYMAPEQAEGKSIDQRADLFSLGTVFYVMLTGRPPFRASGTMAVLKRVCEDMPRPIREIIPEVPEWLCGAIARLHAKKPEERFQTASEVADLLSQHLAHLQQPHLVPQPTAPPTVPPFADRGTTSAPAVQAIKQMPSRRRWKRMLVAACVIAAAGIGTTYFVMRPRDNGPNEPPIISVKGTDRYFDSLKREDIPRGLLAMAGGDPDQAPPEIVAMLGDAGFRMPSGGLTAWMAQNKDGVLAVPCGNQVALYEGATGRLLRVLTGHTNRVIAMAFSPDGKRLVSASFDKTVKVWDALTGQETLALLSHTDIVWSVAFSSDGRHIATASADKTVKLWEADQGTELHSFPRPTANLSVCFSPDGKRLASSSGDDFAVTVWDLDKKEEVVTLKGHTHREYIFRVAFSPDGIYLATGSDDELILWEAATLKRFRTFNTPAGWLAFTLDSKTLFAGRNNCLQGQIHVVTRWDVEGETPVASYTLPSEGGAAVYHLSPDRKTLYGMRCSPPEPFLHVYDAETGKEKFPRHGHAGPAYSVAISPDGRTIASGGADHTVRLWDLAGWKAGDALLPVRTLTGKHKQKGAIRSVVFSPDGKLAASASEDGTIALWDVASGAQGKILRGNSTSSSRIAFSPDGQTLAAGGHNGKIRLWDVATGKLGETLAGHGTTRVRDVAFSPDGKWLASCGDDHFVRLWELPGGDLLGELECKTNAISVAFSKGGKMLAAGSDAPESLLRVWDITDPSNWTLKAELPSYSSHVLTCAFHPSARLVASGAWDGTIRLWDLASDGKSMLTIGGAFGARLNQVTFSPKGGYLVTANDNGTISILKVPAPPPLYDPGKPRKLPDPLELAKRPSAADALKRADIPADLLFKAGRGKVAAPPELVAILAHADSQIHAVTISSDGKFLASAGGAGNSTVRLWNLANGKQHHTMGADQGEVYSPAFGPNIGKGEPGALLLATAQSDGTVKLWEVDTGKEIRTMTGHTATRPKCLAFSSDGRWLACGDTAGTILLWDATTGKRLRTFPGAVADYGQMAFSPDGRFLAAPGADGLIRLWDTANGWQLAVWVGHTAPARSVAFLPDGRTLVSSGQTDKTIRLWDLATLRPKQALEGTRSLAVTLAWRADGRLLASDDIAEGTVRLWDVTTEPPRHKAIHLFPITVGYVVPTQFLGGVAFTPEGRYLAIANPDGTVYILKLAEPGEVFQVPPPHVELQPKAAWPGHHRDVTNILFAGDGKTLFSASKDGFVKLWNFRAEPLKGPDDAVQSVAAQEDGVRAFARAADGKTLATAGFDGIIRLWDAKGKQLHELPGHKGGTAALLFAAGGEQLLSGGADGKVRFWNVKDGKPLGQFDVSKDGITHVSLSRDGKTLATSGDDQVVRLWNLDNTTLKTSLPDRTAACFSPDGKQLAVATRSGLIELRDPSASQVQARLRSHTDSPTHLCFSVNGKRLVSCGKDGGLYVWDAAHGHLLAVLRGGQGRPCCVTLAADGKTIAAGTDDGKLLLWDAWSLAAAGEVSASSQK